MIGVPARRWFVALPAVAILGLLATDIAAAQQGAPVVSHAGPDTVTVAPGERASVPFRLTNGGSREARLTLELGAPEGWRVVPPPAELVLARGESAVRVASFYVPLTAPAGDYPLRLSARGPGAPAADGLIVRVPARREIRLVVEEAPSWTVAGEPYPVDLRLENAGNVVVEVRLVAESPLGHEVTVEDTSAIPLAPGAASRARVQVTPPASLARAVTHPLRILALAEGDTAEAVARVEVVPRGSEAVTRRPGLPASLRLRAGTDGRGGSPVRFHAAGPLGSGGTRVEALLQGPAHGHSLFGETDAYRVRIDGPRGSLRLGDDVYFLSTLTEPGREGQGVGATGRLGVVEAGGYLQRDRRGIAPDTQLAAFLAITPFPGLGLRGNWLRNDGGQGRREVVSAEGELRLSAGFVARGELGRRPRTGAAAHSGQLSGAQGPLSVHLSLLRADSAFGGPYAGLSTASGLLGVRPWREIYLEGSFEAQELGTAAAPFAFGYRHRSARVAAGWGSHLSLEGRALRREAWGTAGPQERTAESVRARIAVPFGPLRLYPSVERGTGREGESGSDRPFWQAGLRSELWIPRGSLGGQVEYFTGGTLHHSVVEEGFSARGYASLSLAEGTHVRLSAYANSYLWPVERQNLLIDGSLEQRLPGGHSVALRIFRRAAYGLLEYGETTVLIDYSIPLGLPLGRGPRPSTLTGRIFDAETGRPLSRVVVRVGDRRVATDASGRLSLSGIPAGTHYVDIDRASADLGLASRTPLPLRVEVRPGARAEFEIALVRSAALTIRTSLARSASLARPGERTAPEPLAGVVLELARDGERVRRETDATGTAELRHLRPGRWTVRVVGAPLPAFHAFSNDSTVVELVPGEAATLDLRALPLERRLELVGGGAVAEARPDSLPAGWSTHRVAANTTLRAVAEALYGDPELWRVLWDANRETVRDPDAVALGTLLRVPPAPDPRRPR